MLRVRYWMKERSFEDAQIPFIPTWNSADLKLKSSCTKCVHL